MLILPDIYKWYEVLETELNLLLKYYCHIVPRAEQVNIHHYRPVSSHSIRLNPAIYGNIGSQVKSAGLVISWREIIKLIKSQKLNQYLRTLAHEILLLIVDLINLLFKFYDDDIWIFSGLRVCNSDRSTEW